MKKLSLIKNVFTIDKNRFLKTLTLLFFITWTYMIRSLMYAFIEFENITLEIFKIEGFFHFSILLFLLFRLNWNLLRML